MLEGVRVRENNYIARHQQADNVLVTRHEIITQSKSGKHTSQPHFS